MIGQWSCSSLLLRVVFFFFSSRRRHTRFKCDWSSDVCSSDLSDDRTESRAIVRDILKLEHQNPQWARARATLQGHTDDIIDGADLIRLAERELMTPLDQEARRLVSSAAQRVSIVTAVSPRALVDVLFVFAVSLLLIRQLA